VSQLEKGVEIGCRLGLANSCSTESAVGECRKAKVQKGTTVSPILTVPMAETHRPLPTYPVVRRCNEERSRNSRKEVKKGCRLGNANSCSTDSAVGECRKATGNNR
jgi:hypothetical protein